MWFDVYYDSATQKSDVNSCMQGHSESHAQSAFIHKQQWRQILRRHRCKISIFGFILKLTVCLCIDANRILFFTIIQRKKWRQSFFLIRILFYFLLKCIISARSSCFHSLVSSPVYILGRVLLMRTNADEQLPLNICIRRAVITRWINTFASAPHSINLISPEWLWSYPAWPAI